MLHLEKQYFVHKMAHWYPGTCAGWHGSHSSQPPWCLSQCDATRASIVMLLGDDAKAELWCKRVKQTPVQSSLQFQSSKSRRTEAVNRATGVPFLPNPSQPLQAVFLLLIIEDCFFHPWGSVVLLDFHFSFPFIQFPYCPSDLSKNILPPHQHWSTTHVPCQSARAASDAAVPSRSEKAENDRAGDTGMGGGSWLLPPWQPCVFVSARESDKRWLTVRRKHTQSHSCSYSHLLKGSQIRTATPTCMEREEKGARWANWICGVLTQRKKKNKEQNGKDVSEELSGR